MSWLRKHALLVALIGLYLLVLALGTYGDWITYQSDQQAHHESARFFSRGFLLGEWGGIQWGMNVQSEILGAILVLVFKDAIRRWLRGEPAPPDEEA